MNSSSVAYGLSDQPTPATLAGATTGRKPPTTSTSASPALMLSMSRCSSACPVYVSAPVHSQPPAPSFSKPWLAMYSG